MAPCNKSRNIAYFVVIELAFPARLQINQNSNFQIGVVVNSKHEKITIEDLSISRAVYKNVIMRTLKTVMVGLKGRTFEFNFFKHSARFLFIIWQVFFSEILIYFYRHCKSV